MTIAGSIPSPMCCSDGTDIEHILLCNNGVWEVENCDQVGDLCEELDCPIEGDD